MLFTLYIGAALAMLPTIVFIPFIPAVVRFAMCAAICAMLTGSPNLGALDDVQFSAQPPAYCGGESERRRSTLLSVM